MNTIKAKMHCMSIYTCYVDEMRKGVKQFELRKYDPHIEPGEWVLIYETLPTGSVGAAFKAGDTLISDPRHFWLNYRAVLGIDEEPYFKYFRGKAKSYAVEIDEFVEFEPIGLDRLRSRYGFRAPQGVVRVHEPLRSVIESLVRPGRTEGVQSEL